MRCPQCGTDSWGPFCSNCGVQIAPIAPKVTCPRCWTQYNLVVCPVCGLPSPYFQSREPTYKQNLDAFLSIVWDTSLILTIILLAMNLVTLLYATGVLMVPNIAGGGLASIPIFTIFPTLAVLFYITNSFAIAVYFILIIATVFYAYIHFTVFDGKGLLRLMASPLQSIVPRLRSRNRWVMVTQLFLASTFFQVTFILILNIGGIETNPPPGTETEPLWMTMFGLVNASVFEEFISRMLMIGLPMFFGSLIFRTLEVGRGVTKTTRERTTGRYLLGSFRYLYGGNISRNSPKSVLFPATILGLLSSILFGIAHQGWGAWKLLPAFVAGLALSYAFLRGGFLTAVLLHFTVDYLAGTALITIDDLAFQVFISFFIIVLLVLGSGFFLYYCVYFVNLCKEVVTGKKPQPVADRPLQYVAYAAQQPQAPSDGQQMPGTQYVFPTGMTPFVPYCPYCGWPESSYVEGRFRCLRCGRTR